MQPESSTSTNASTAVDSKLAADVLPKSTDLCASEPSAVKPRRASTFSQITSASAGPHSAAHGQSADGDGALWPAWRSLQTQANHARFLDAFAYSPRYEFPPYRSCPGAIITVVLLVILVGYIYVTIQDFAHPTPITSESRSETEWSAVQAPPLVLLFRSTGTIYYNDSFFYVTFKEIVIQNQDRVPRQTRLLGTTSCPILEPVSGQVTPWLCAGTDFAPTVNQSLFSAGPARIEGTYEQPRYRYVEAAIRLCCDSPTSCAPHCQPWTASLDRLHTLDLNMVQSDLIPAGASLTASNSERHTVNNVTYTTTDIFFYKRQSTIRPRYVFDETASAALKSDFRVVYNQNPRPSDPVRWKMFLRLSYSMVKEDVQYQTVLDLIGSWGALWSALVIIGLVAHFANQKWFNTQLSGLDLRYLNATDFDAHGRLTGTNEFYEMRRRLMMTRAPLEEYIGAANTSANAVEQLDSDALVAAHANLPALRRPSSFK